jgi:hypothetical protein
MNCFQGQPTKDCSEAGYVDVRTYHSQGQNDRDSRPGACWEPQLTVPRRSRIAVLAPLAIIGISLWLLIGCIYIPTPKILHLSGSRQDFRPLVGNAGSDRPIVSRRISRAAVEAILGPPPFVSENRRRSLYVIHVKKDLWIMPLCFSVADINDEATGLLLNFDETGMLDDWKQLHEFGGWYLISGQFPSDAGLVERANTPPSTTQSANALPYPVAWQLRPNEKATLPR